MLENRALPPELRGTDELSARGLDLIGAGNLKANGVLSRLWGERFWGGHLDPKAQMLETPDKALAQMPIGREYASGHMGVRRGRHNGIGELIGMQDGTAASGAAHEVPPSLLQSRHVDVGNRLRMTQR